MSKHTPGPWFMSGVRFKMNGGEWHSINRYDEATKQDENIACVGYAPSTGAGLADARLIAAAPDLLAALKSLEPVFDELHAKWDEGMRAGKLLIALMDPTLNYRADVTAIHAAISKAEGK